MTQQLIEELIVTPGDYPEKIDMSNPHPSANVRFGKFDVNSGAKISDENGWYVDVYASTITIGDGFSFTCIGGFSVRTYWGGRKYKVFIDGVFVTEVTTEVNDWEISYEKKFVDHNTHEVTLVMTFGAMVIDYISFIPANLPALQNPGTVSDYPVVEVESLDTEAMFGPHGKKVGDADHPFEIAHFYRADPLSEITPTTSGTPTQAYYDKVAFLDGDTFLPVTSTAGRFAVARLKWDLKVLQSPYFGMLADEIKNFMQFILSEIWACARGANGGQMVYGIELYCWSGVWTHIAGGDHALDYPKLIQWGNDTDSLPHYINEGEITFLLKPKYPSDGTISSAVWLDHCRLGTVMNYAKLGADAITNYGGNLLENGWGKYYTSGGYNQGYIFEDLLYTHDGEKKVYPGQQITISYESWRDADSVKNDILPNIYLLHYAKDGTYLGAVGTWQCPEKANVWERITYVALLKNDPEMGTIKAMFYRNPNTTLSGGVGIRNAVLSDGEKIIYLGPQEKYIIGFTSEQALAKDDILAIDGTALHVKKNDVSVIDSLSSTFNTNGFKLAPGLNHFKTSHIGGNMKIRVIKESMPKIAAFDGIYFSAITSMPMSKKKTGDKDETAGGKLRQDIVRTRRIWDIETGLLTREEANELIDHLESKLYGSGYFWLEEFGGGGNAIEAYIDPDNLKKDPTSLGLVRLSFQVEER